MKRAFLPGLIAAFCVVGVARFAAMAAPPAGTAVAPRVGGQFVTGTVSCGERIKIPGMATVHVELLDLSGTGPRPGTLGEQTIWLASSPLPVSFQIVYDPSRIDPRHDYIVRARIMDGEKLLYMNTKPYYVLTKGAPRTVDILVTPAQARAR